MILNHAKIVPVYILYGSCQVTSTDSQGLCRVFSDLPVAVYCVSSYVFVFENDEIQ